MSTSLTGTMIRAIIVGPPGSGKGTISNLMVKTFGVKHISSGDLMRLHLLNSTPPPSLQSAMKEGKLIPDNVIEEVVLPELKQHPHWLLDGFPRTLKQAKSLLLNQQQVDMMINLNVPDKTIIERLQGRWIHISSGRIYNAVFNPPKVEGLDDVTGESLEQREDDHPEVVKHRLMIYHAQIDPILDYFNQLNLLNVYTGTESKTIWPLIKKDVQHFLEEK